MIKNKPIFIEVAYGDIHKLFTSFANEPWAFLLDSANFNRQLDDTNRYSYIVANPFKKIIVKDGKDLDKAEIVADPFIYLKNILANFQQSHHPEFPPFQGGAVGYFSYDLCHYLENINKPSNTSHSVYADLAIGLYDVILSFDHVLKKAWIVSSGCAKFAEDKIEYYQKKLETPAFAAACGDDLLENIDLVSSFDKAAYTRLVQQTQDYIREGDVFEVNLSHRFQANLNSPLKNKYALYLKMREQNQSPFSAFLNLGDHQILSTSPERFLLLRANQTVSTRPIKGTAPRGKTPQQDEILAKELSTSEKNRSENIMITDLMRNDLSKVCHKNSVEVKKLCGLESYPTVHHLVTVVEGQLREEFTALDLLKACFPGGSITGAPKVRAMQIIYELEPTARGPYCGSIGYIGFDGVMDTSIVIRTLLVNGNTISYQAGGAVVLDSSPEGEYEETMVKSASIRRTISNASELV